MENLFLPDDYLARDDVNYFDDSPYAASDVVHQPDVYYAADYFCRAARRSTIIDIGCGNGRKLLDVRTDKKVGVDFGINIEACRRKHPTGATWIEADLSKPDCINLAEHADSQSVVVCADVVEHLVDPMPLIALLARCYRNGAIVLTSTPDRIRVRGAEHRGPPPNPSHIREWALEEYEKFLLHNGLPAAFAGYTINNNIAKELKTIVTVHDCTVFNHGMPARRPLAIISAYNEDDVVGEVVVDLVKQGCDVAAIDNWSTDATWQILNKARAQYPDNIVIERFPSNGSPPYYEWRKILQRKEEIAHHQQGRWIIHTDADELRRSPFPGLTLAEGLKLAQNTGANRVAFNLVNFRPTTDRPFQPGTLESSFSHFEFATRPGHVRQAKAWLQGSQRVDLASSGGHVVTFDNANDYPYRFLLQHYPIRSVEHGRRKVLEERQTRWSPEERKMGWHIQYDNFDATSTFRWSSAELWKFDQDFWRSYGLPIMTDIVERRYKAF